MAEKITIIKYKTKDGKLFDDEASADSYEAVEEFLFDLNEAAGMDEIRPFVIAFDSDFIIETIKNGEFKATITRLNDLYTKHFEK